MVNSNEVIVSKPYSNVQLESTISSYNKKVVISRKLKLYAQSHDDLLLKFNKLVMMPKQENLQDFYVDQNSSCINMLKLQSPNTKIETITKIIKSLIFFPLT